MCAQKALDKDQEVELAAMLAKAGLSGVIDSFVREKVTPLVISRSVYEE